MSCAVNEIMKIIRHFLCRLLFVFLLLLSAENQLIAIKPIDGRFFKTLYSWHWTPFTNCWFSWFNLQLHILSQTKILLYVTVGIVAAAGSRPLECFWCGPLANQVHKSTRPPPCEGPGNHFMICEQQYTHCATVYSSPRKCSLSTLLNKRKALACRYTGNL